MWKRKGIESKQKYLPTISALIQSPSASTQIKATILQNYQNFIQSNAILGAEDVLFVIKRVNEFLKDFQVGSERTLQRESIQTLSLLLKLNIQFDFIQSETIPIFLASIFDQASHVSAGNQENKLEKFIQESNKGEEGNKAVVKSENEAGALIDDENWSDEEPELPQFALKDPFQLLLANHQLFLSLLPKLLNLINTQVPSTSSLSSSFILIQFIDLFNKLSNQSIIHSIPVLLPFLFDQSVAI